MIGVLTGLAAFIPYAEPVPWLELQTLVVFAAGYLLGVRSGVVIGALAMGFYSLANPQGLAHPAIFAAQVIGRAAVGAMGGWAAALGLPRSLWLRGLVLAIWGLATALVFDVVTNLATGLVYGQMVRTLWLGLSFAIGHLASNTVFFVLVGVPLIALLEPKRKQLLTMVMLGLLLVVGDAHAQVQSADTTATGARDRVPSSSADTTSASMPSDSTAMTVVPAPVDSAVVDSALYAPPDSGQPVFRAAPPPVVEPFLWSLQLPPRAQWRRSPTDSDDALSVLGAAPRFYGDAGSLEPVRLLAFPGGLELLSCDGVAQAARSTPWQDPGRVSEGSRSSWSWSPLGRPTALRVPAPRPAPMDQRRDPGEGSASQPGIDAATADAKEGRPLTSVWIGAGDYKRQVQGFNLQLWQNIGNVPFRVNWAAWTRNTDRMGELGDSGAHGIEVGLTGRGKYWRGEAVYESDRAAVSQRDQYLEERRSLELGWFRFDWKEPGDAGNYAGLAAARIDDGTTGDGPIIQPLRREADEFAASVWGGRRYQRGELSAALSWSNQQVRHELSGVPVYLPPVLNVYTLMLEARTQGGTGHWRGIAEVERANGVTTVMPQLHWWRDLGRSSRLFVSGGAQRVTTVSEAGKLGDPEEGSDIERSHGWVGLTGYRFSRGIPSDRTATTAANIDAAMAKGELHLQLSVVGWSLSDVVFPAFGLFGRDILEEAATTADVKGIALAGRGSWAPIRGLEMDLSGYASGREIPLATASAAPDFLLVYSVGPRFFLFSRTLEVAIQGEVDLVGQRVASDAVLPVFQRFGGRLFFGLGDAWLVIRATDLQDEKYPLPGRRFDGARLLSVGRQLRIYGEWRLLD